MASVNLEDLFDDSRITQWDWTLLLLVIYTPIGLVLLLIRIFALIQFYLLFLYLPYSPIRKYILRLFGTVLGVLISEKHSGKSASPDNLIWVANHCSPFDWIVLHVIADKRTPIIFPEGTTTSGKAGLLKFQKKSLENYKRKRPNLPAQPVTLRAVRPFPCTAITVLDTPLWMDIFFTLFSPCTTFNVRFLEPVSCREDEELEAYVERLETVVSTALGLNVTPFTVKDKEELVKRKRIESHRPPTTVQRPSNRFQLMANQVKEILPHVPLAAIMSDLNRTNSVDVTIANFVEGVVPFTPEPVAQPRTENLPSSSTVDAATPSTSKMSTSSSTGQLIAQASSFGKSAQERGLSLQERKARLLREAQLRYCEKHGLKVPGINC